MTEHERLMDGIVRLGDAYVRKGEELDRMVIGAFWQRDVRKADREHRRLCDQLEALRSGYADYSTRLWRIRRAPTRQSSDEARS